MPFVLLVKYSRMQKGDIQTVNIEELTDLKNIIIDMKLPVEEKLRLFAEKTNNLYVCRIGDHVVKLVFMRMVQAVMIR